MARMGVGWVGVCGGMLARPFALCATCDVWVNADEDEDPCASYGRPSKG